MSVQAKRVKVTNDNVRGRMTHIELDGVNISSSCVGASLEWAVDGLNVLELRMFAAPTEVETLALVRIRPECAQLLVDLGWTPPPEQVNYHPAEPAGVADTEG